METKPYITFVAVGRNDNYGHRFTYRFQKFVDNLTYLCEKYELPSELLLVEWNPPKENKKLSEIIKTKKDRRYLSIEFIEVPEKVHKRYKNSDKLGLFEYRGKNVGVRRAKGEFVLITNPDIIYNDELIKFFAKRKLVSGRYYRIARYEMRKDVADKGPKEVLIECKRDWEFKQSKYIKLRNVLHFGKFTKEFARMIGGVPIYFYRKKIKNSKVYKYVSYPCPGDFTLMSKKDWELLKGFPEIDIKAYLDDYCCVRAATAGLKLVELKSPKRIYHQFHEMFKIEDGAVRGREADFLRDSKIMIKQKKPIEYNDDNWGLKKEKLKVNKK